MLNKNLFILLFSFVIVKSFALVEPESSAKDSYLGQEVVKNSVAGLPKDGSKEVLSEAAKEKPTEKPEAVKDQTADKIAEKPVEKVVEKKEVKEEKTKESATEKQEIVREPVAAEPEKIKVKDKVKSKKDRQKEVEKKKPEVFLIDKIETVIYGPEETSIITKSDLERTGLDGQKRTKEKMIFELQVYQDAKKYNIEDEKLVDKYIESIQAEQNLSLNDIKKMAYDFGYSYEDFRRELGRLSVTGQIIDYKVRSKVIIPEKEVREYYDANPEYVQEAYNLQRIFVPVNADTDLDAEIKNIEAQIKSGEVIEGADYSENFWVEKPELAEDKQFISSMVVNAYSEPVLLEVASEAGEITSRGLEIFKLVERRERQLATFDQRYREITDKLREPLYNSLFDEYKESLIKDSVIIDL